VDDDNVISTLHTFTIHYNTSLVAKWATNDNLRREYEISSALKLNQMFDRYIINAAQKTTQKISTKETAVFGWNDFIRMDAKLDDKEVPSSNRAIVIPSTLKEQFYNIDVIKNLIAFNKQVFDTGELVDIMGKKFFIMSKAAIPDVDNKDNIVEFYGPGMAFILSAYAELEEVYSPKLKRKIYDLNSFATAELDDNKFAVVMKLK
jgi:hypothetical protein